MKKSLPMEARGPIAEAAQGCINSLNECLTIAVLMDNEWAENRLADLNLWISGTGTLAKNRASLDSRLATKLESREAIANLLRLLATVIDQCKSIVQTEEPSHLDKEEETLAESRGEDDHVRSISPWSDESSSDGLSEVGARGSNLVSTRSRLHECMHNIEAMIEQLSRIAVAIRRSGRRSRLQKADQRFKPAEHQELQDHLMAMLLIPRNLDNSGLNEIHLRLIRCNLKRRNRFLYAQQHSRGLDGSHLGHSTPANMDGQVGTGGKQLAEKAQDMRLSKKQDGSTKNPTIRTGTSASAISESFTIPKDDTPAPAAASSIVSSTAIDLDYPHPPKIKDSANIFRCPCCCEALPVAMADKSRWRKHISDDLSPYTCILPGCDEPDVLFSTKDVWRRHLLKAHRSVTYWICFACGDGTQFSSEEAFITHTRSSHSASIPSDQISALTSLSKNSAPTEIRRCPLCNWPDEGEGEVQKNVLLDHIAKEIHSFSLLALPWSDDNGQEVDERIKQSSGKVYEWLVQNNIQDNPDHERVPREKKTFFSEYFQHNAYFAEGSGESAPSELHSDMSRASDLEELKQIQGSIDFKSQIDDAIPSPAKRHYVVPVETIPHYIQREDLWEELQKKMRVRHENAIVPYAVSLCGSAGSGKTQLALKYARSNTKKYNSILWINAIDEGALRRSFIQCAVRLGLEEDKRHDGRRFALVDDWAVEPVLEWLRDQTEANGEWLVIFDNVDDLSWGIQQVIPSGSRGSVLITSRDNRSQLLVKGGCEAVQVGAMSSRKGEEPLSALEVDTGPDEYHAARSDETKFLLEMYIDEGRWKEAENVQLQMLEACKAKLGEDHPDTLQCLDYLVSIYGGQNRWAEAEKLEQRIIETYKNVVGEEHPDTLNGMTNLAFILVQQDRLEEAEQVQVQVIEGRKATLGGDHPDTLNSMSYLASIYLNQLQLKEAETLQIQVMETYKVKLGTHHPDTLTSMNDLAFTLAQKVQLKEAEKIQVQVIEGRKEVLGADHSETLDSMAQLASIFMRQDRLEEAEKLKAQVEEMRKAGLDEDDPDTPGIQSLPTTPPPLISPFVDPDSIEDHWAREVFNGSENETPITPGRERPGCFGGEAQPGLKPWLREQGYERLLNLAFNEDSKTKVSFFVRDKDHRVRIVCKVSHPGRSSDYFCLPLNLLEIVRNGSCLQLCRRRNSEKELVVWARFQFTTLESLVIFFVTFLALRAQDAGHPVSDIRDYELKGETELYGGLIIDDNYKHALRIFQDNGTKVVRLQSSVYKGNMDHTPVWTAFITSHLARRNWVRVTDDRTVLLRDLRPTILMASKRYSPPRTERGEHVLNFVIPNDADEFLGVIGRLVA